MAEEGVRSLTAALPVIAPDPLDAEARTDALRGAWLCGAAAEQALRRALSADDVPGHLARTAVGLGAPRSLTELGLTRHDIDEITAQAQTQPYVNPLPVTEELVRSLLTSALNATRVP